MSGPRGPYRKSAERRSQILDAAFQVFSRSGYSASSVNEIAAAVGVTQTAVLHHFSGGKIALLRAVLEQRDRSAEIELEGLDGRRFLGELLEISRQQVGQRGVVQLYSMLAAEAIDPAHPAHDYFAQRFMRIAAAVEAAFRAVNDEGGLRPGTDPRRAALSTMASVEGAQLLWLSGLDIDFVAESRRVINSFLVDPI